VSPTNGDSNNRHELLYDEEALVDDLENPFTEEETAAQAAEKPERQPLDFDAFAKNLARKPKSEEPIPPVTRLKRVERTYSAEQQTRRPSSATPAAAYFRVSPAALPKQTKRPAPPTEQALPLVPKTPAPPLKKQKPAPPPRPTVQYTEALPVLPKNPFRAKYIQENIALRVELEVLKRLNEAQASYTSNKHAIESRAAFKEGVAAGLVKAATVQLGTTSQFQQTALKKAHNKKGFERRAAKRAARQQA
jgi:hypothetical protein